MLTAADVVVLDQSPLAGRDARAQSTPRSRKAPVRQRVEIVELATMVRPADESRAVARMAELQAVDPRLSRSTASSCCADGQPLRPRAARGPRRARAARTAGATRASPSATQVRIGDEHVHDPRRHRERAGRGGPACSASARASSSRVRDLDGPGCSRSAPRAFRDPDEGGRSRHRAAGRGRTRAIQGQLRRRRGRTGPPRIASARTCASRRTT